MLILSIYPIEILEQNTQMLIAGLFVRVKNGRQPITNRGMVKQNMENTEGIQMC